MNGIATAKIQSLWIGETLSVMEQLSIRSFLAHGHSYDLYVYQPVDGVPKGATLRDANEILPLALERFRYDDIPSPAAFASVFRYKLLHERGGIWVDTDVVCLRSIQLAEDYCFPLTSGLIMLGRNKKFSVDNWFIKAPQGCEMIKYCYDAAVERADTFMHWGTIGPNLLTSAVKTFALGQFARGTLFFPINWSKVELFVKPTPAARLTWKLFQNHSIAIHLYRGNYIFYNCEGLRPQDVDI